jgi:hypothetical protein
MSNVSTPRGTELKLVKEILKICESATGAFRILPRPEYVANLANRLAEERLNPLMVQYMFDQAVKYLDHYPSLAEMLKIAQSSKVRAMFTRHVAAIPEHIPAVDRETPWPYLVEATMKAVLEPETEAGGKFMFKQVYKVNGDDVEILKKSFLAKDFENVEAVAIIERYFPDDTPS